MPPLRKLILPAAVLGCIVWYQNRPHPDALDGLWKRITLPYHVLRLTLQPPDEVLPMPVEGVRAALVANTWHAARTEGRRHEGQDIFAPRGAPVYSATRGVVIRVGENRLGGKSVSVLGSGGRSYYYAHLERYAGRIGRGDKVDANTVLGYVGTSGNAAGTPPHLHFGIYTSQGPIDPLPLLVDRL